MLFLTACDDIDWWDVICSDEDKGVIMKIVCGVQGKGGGGDKDDEKCPSPRMVKYYEDCVCGDKYPIQVGKQCFSFQEHEINTEGDPMACQTVHDSQIQQDCIREYADIDDCDDYDDASAVGNCYMLYGDKIEQCQEVLNREDRLGCFTRIGGEPMDCKQLLSGVDQSTCLVALGTVEDCKWIFDKDNTHMLEFCRDEFEK